MHAYALYNDIMLIMFELETTHAVAMV